MQCCSTGDCDSVFVFVLLFELFLLCFLGCCLPFVLLLVCCLLCFIVSFLSLFYCFVSFSVSFFVCLLWALFSFFGRLPCFIVCLFVVCSGVLVCCIC